MVIPLSSLVLRVNCWRYCRQIDFTYVGFQPYLRPSRRFLAVHTDNLPGIANILSQSDGLVDLMLLYYGKCSDWDWITVEQCWEL